MGSEFIKLHPDNPSQNKIIHITEILRNGGVIIYPTDTIYGMGCDIFNHKAVEKIKRIKGINSKHLNFSFICYDLSETSEYVRNFSTTVYKVLKKALPGPFTFIMNASSRAPKTVLSGKKTVGIRIPDNNIPLEIVKELGNPIVTTSIRDEDEVIEYSTDPELIFEKFKHQVDAVINGGPGDNTPSTVVDCTDDSFEVLREGKGFIEEYL